MPTISNLPPLENATDDTIIPVVDVNENPDVTKKLTLRGLRDYFGYVGSEGSFIPTPGYTGSKGVGYTGSRGTNGKNGYIGSAGYIGSPGYIGSLGYFGSIGYTGSIGITGDVGYIGSQGYDGSLGYTGSIGIGYTGSASDQIGYTGSIGYAGSQGDPLTVKGGLETTNDLSSVISPNDGDGYLITSHLWVYNSAGYGGSVWTDAGNLQGPSGYTGSIGYYGSIGYVGSQGTNDASLINFLQAGTGAVTRTVENKLREVVHVKDFGAVGDGVTNDRDAIEAAILAAKVIDFGTSTYLIGTSPISIPSNRTLMGNGATIFSAITNDTVFEAYGTANDTFTSSIPTSNVNIATDTITLNGHGLINGQAVVYDAGYTQSAVAIYADYNDINTATNVINISSHGLSTGTSVTYDKQGGTTIGGLVDGTVYYARKIDNDNFYLYNNSINANAGTTTGRMVLTTTGYPNLKHRFLKALGISGLSDQTTYFVGSTATNTFKLYADSGLTTVKDLTSTGNNNQRFIINNVLRADVEEGKFSVTVSNEDLSTGDWVQLNSDDRYIDWKADYQAVTAAEYLQVREVTGSGINKTITFTTPVSAQGYTIANGARLTKVNLIENIIVKGLKFEGTGVLLDNQQTLQFDYVKNITISDCEFNSIDIRHIRLYSCLYANIYNNKHNGIFTTVTSPNSIGCFVLGSSQYVNITNNFFEKCMGIYIGATSRTYKGYPLYVNAHHNQIFDVNANSSGRSTAIYINGGRIVSVNNNLINGARLGIYINSKRNEIFNNAITNVTVAGIQIGATVSDTLQNIKISGNHINRRLDDDGTTNQGYGILASSSLTELSYIDISDNLINNFSLANSSGIFIASPTVNSAGVVISNNKVYTSSISNNTTVNYGIRSNAKGSVIMGNHIIGFNTGIYAGANGITIKGNLIEWSTYGSATSSWPASGSYGIDSASDGLILDTNVVRRSRKPVNLTGKNNIIVNNLFSGYLATSDFGTTAQISGNNSYSGGTNYG